MIGPIIVVSGFIIIGIVALFFPREIQRYLIRSCEKWPPLFQRYPPQKYIRTERYIWELRLIGVVALAVGLYSLRKFF